MKTRRYVLYVENPATRRWNNAVGTVRVHTTSIRNRPFGVIEVNERLGRLIAANDDTPAEPGNGSRHL